MSKKNQIRGKKNASCRKNLTRADFAKAILEATGKKLSERRIGQLWADGMPKTSLQRGVDWYRLNVEQHEKAAGIEFEDESTGEKFTKAEEQAKAARLDRMRKEAEWKIRSGELMELSQVKRLIAELIQVSRKHYAKMEAWYAPYLTREQRNEA